MFTGKVVCISQHKTHGKKLKLAKAHVTASPSPRWADIKKFGLGLARSHSIKRFRNRKWRRDSINV